MGQDKGRSLALAGRGTGRQGDHEGRPYMGIAMCDVCRGDPRGRPVRDRPVRDRPVRG